VEIRGCVAIVAGGASGMARATAQRLAEKGANIAILDLPQSKGEEAAKELSALGILCTFHPCDITDFEHTETVIEEIMATHGALHIAVNTAGSGSAQRTVKKDGPHDLASFRRLVDLNLVATFNLNRLQAWHMSKNEPNEEGERGVIIDTSSIAAFEGQIGQVAYAATKAAIVGMVFTMARDLGSLGIRAVAIAPSLFATGLTALVPEQMAESLTKDAAFPRRMGKPDEYARLAIAIVENPMLNGTTIRLDAGQRFAPK
jgi:NAD(P)-dependent dehydrogenase (short-subunit alcohol dehydrogenase family)